MRRGILSVLLITCGVARADDSPARLAPATPPADATPLPGGGAWKTVIAGSGTAHPGAQDWVAVYGGRADQPAWLYYMALPLAVDRADPLVKDALPRMLVGERRRFWPPRGPVHDVELAAILGTTKPAGDLVLAPAPGDARVGASGLPSVTLRTGRGPVRPEDADRVLLQGVVVGGDGKAAALPNVAPGTTTLADVPFAPARDALREMVAGEERYFWIPAARNQGAPLVMRLMLISLEKRPQVAAPADVGAPPKGARRLPSGVAYVVLAAGKGGSPEPPEPEDEAVTSYTIWSESGRTLEKSQGARWEVRDYPAGLAEVLAGMRVGERRRVWIPAALAGYLSENHMAAVAEITLNAVHRNIDPLPDGMKIRVTGYDGLEVVRGAQRAPLPIYGRHLMSVKLSADGAAVTIARTDHCDADVTSVLTVASLRARLENAAALGLHRQKRWREAAAGFARAAALDPELDLAAVNLASALALAGDKQAAAVALAPLARRNPVWVSWRLADDPELAGVAAAPELAFLRAGAPGRVDLARMPVTVDPSGRFVAVLVDEASWGSGDSETRLEILEVTSGKIVATIPHVTWDLMTQEMTPAIRAEVAKRRAHVERLLDDLGFTAPADLELPVDPEPEKARFAKARLGLVIGTGAVRVVRGDTVLVEAPPVDGHIEGAVYLPGLRTFVLVYGRAGHEGCEGTDPRGVALIRVP